MGAVADCQIDADDRDAAVSAATWVQAFYPGVAVTLNLDVATLVSAERSRTELLLIWRGALLNEQLLARSAKQRAAVLDVLMR